MSKSKPKPSLDALRSSLSEWQTRRDNLAREENSTWDEMDILKAALQKRDDEADKDRQEEAAEMSTWYKRMISYIRPKREEKAARQRRAGERALARETREVEVRRCLDRRGVLWLQRDSAEREMAGIQQQIDSLLSEGMEGEEREESCGAEAGGLENAEASAASGRK